MLNELIEAHKRAMTEFERACEELDSICTQYDESQSGNRVKVKIGIVSPLADQGREDLLNLVDHIMQPITRQMPTIKALSSEFAEQFETFIATARANLEVEIDAAIAEEERRKEAYGVTESRQEWEVKRTVETQALNAICSYNCANHDEERRRLKYLMSDPAINYSIEDFVPLLLQSVIDSPALAA